MNLSFNEKLRKNLREKGKEAVCNWERERLGLADDSPLDRMLEPITLTQEAAEKLAKEMDDD